MDLVQTPFYQKLPFILFQPVRDAYRNKDEFSVWTGLNGDPKTMGFFIGSPVVGRVVCVPATELKCIRESHKEIAQVLIHIYVYIYISLNICIYVYISSYMHN